MHPRISSLPSTTPDAGFLGLWQGLIVALGPLASEYDRRWRCCSCFSSCAPDARAAPPRWPSCGPGAGPLPQPVSNAAPSKTRPQLDENEFKPFHAEILRSAALRAGPAQLLVDFNPVAHSGERWRRWQSIRRAGCRASWRMSARPSSTFASGPGRAAASGPCTAHTGDNPSARSRNGTGADPQPHRTPDADTAGRRNERDWSTCRLHKHSNHAPDP